MATIEEMKAQRTELEAQVENLERLGVDTGALYDAIDELDTRIQRAETEEEEQQAVEQRAVRFQIKLRESGTSDTTMVDVYEGDTYEDVAERNGIACFINGDERKMRTNLGAVADMEDVVKDGVTRLTVSLPKIDPGA